MFVFRTAMLRMMLVVRATGRGKVWLIVTACYCRVAGESPAAKGFNLAAGGRWAAQAQSQIRHGDGQNRWEGADGLGGVWLLPPRAIAGA
jgi:hypothetical protein